MCEIGAATAVAADAYGEPTDIPLALDRAEQRIFSLAERRLQGNAIPVKSILTDTFKYIETLYERKEHVTGVATGLTKLDEMTAGAMVLRAVHADDGVRSHVQYPGLWTPEGREWMAVGRSTDR